MKLRSFWKELICMCLYYSTNIGYFYAWNYVGALMCQDFGLKGR